MRVNVQTRNTSRFIDLWGYVALAIAATLLAALLLSLFLGQLLISTDLQISEGEPETLQPIQVEQAASGTPKIGAPRIGALRIDVKAIIPSNRWVTYEIQLRDQQDQILVSALKQAWAESGTWQEDGESGTWQEEDLLAGLDVKATEPITITVEVLEYTDIAGQEIDESVIFTVQVRNGVVDTRYLWAGLIGTAGLTAIALISIPVTGDRVISKRIADSDVGDRALMGGPNRLIRVTVDVKADETSPHQFTVKLFVKDGNGEQIYARDFPIRASFTKEKHGGDITGAKAKLCKFFVLEPRSSYGLYVEVVPDNPVDATHLIVRDNAKTLTKAEVIYLRAV